MEPAAVLHLVWVTLACLVSCQGVSIFCAGEAMPGGPGNRVGRTEEGCCGSGLAAQPLAASLSPWLLGLGMTSWLRRKKWG